MRLINLWRDELAWANANGIWAPGIAWLVFGLWSIAAIILTTITMFLTSDVGNTLATAVGLIVGPLIGLCIWTYRQLSVRVWAYHDRGWTEYRRRMSWWRVKPPQFSADYGSSKIYGVWAGPGNTDTGHEPCDAPTGQVCEAFGRDEPHSKLDCMPAIIETFHQGPGEEAGELYQKATPWEIQFLNRKRGRKTTAQTFVQYGSVSLLAGGIWLLIFLTASDMAARQ